jgi:hypothetical protein
MTRRALLVVVSTVLAACSWGQYGGDAAHSSSQPFETRIGTGNVSTLTTSWTATGPFRSGVVTGGKVYTNTVSRLAVFDASGHTGCSSGATRTCAPLFTGIVAVGQPHGTPAVGGGTVYVTSGNGSAGALSAFDAEGVQGCSGNPTQCTPRWTATVAGIVNGSPALADGRVYVGGADGRLSVFDASGTQGCAGSPRVCLPLWTATPGGQLDGTPAIAGGLVYVTSSNGNVDAYDAAGSAGCSGVPKTCAPRWHASTPGPVSASPAVVDGVLYVGVLNASHSAGALDAFDAGGVAGCSGTPTLCTPLWSAPLPSFLGTGVAVAGGHVFATASDGTLYSFDAHGVSGCGGVPRTCAPEWSAPSVISSAPPAVANGVVYAANAGDVRAFDAAGATHCSGSPRQCTPIWQSPSLTGIGVDGVIVVNGMVYAGTADGQFDAFGLPPG